MRKWILTFFISALAMPLSGHAGPLDSYRVYLDDTIKSLELMRGPNGLVNDDAFVSQTAGKCTLKIINKRTSATNIALDIINQLDLMKNPQKQNSADKTLKKIFGTLAHLERHGPSGMFYGWYSTDADSHPIYKNLSSVDNIHLALALWTTHEIYPEKEYGVTAKKLFDDMNFSYFVTKKGLFTANFEFDERSSKWKREQSIYSFLGSEARSIYALAQPLGLLREIPKKGAARPSNIKDAKVESYTGPGGPIMRTWDGGAFQLLLPEILIGEDNYSYTLKMSFDNFATFVRTTAKEKGYAAPAVFSACNHGTSTNENDDPKYVGLSGTRDLTSKENHISKRNHEFDDVVTPHGVFMAATRDPEGFVDALKTMEGIVSKSVPPQKFYCAGLGFTDGLFVSGPQKGQVVTTQLSLDQGMILMALNHILSSDGHNASSRALMDNPQTRQSLTAFYEQFDDLMTKAGHQRWPAGKPAKKK